MIQELACAESSDSDRWDRTLGHAWAQVLRSQMFSRAETVLEIGPGFTTKVGFGLAELDFRGTLIVVEPNRPACTWVIGQYRRLLPHAEVLAVQTSVPDTTPLASRSIDLLVANHILDDLLLSVETPPPASARLFAGMRPGAVCSREFIQVWRRLLLTPERLDPLADRVVQDLAEYVAAVQPGRVVFNQYPSGQHRRHGLDAIEDQSLRILRLLKKKIGGYLFKSVSSTFDDTLLWLAGPPRSCERKA